MPNFTESIKTTAELLQQIESEPSNHDLRERVTALLGSIDGARGFFVALLTGTSKLADQPESWLFEAFRCHDELVSELLVKNLVMSTATGIAHKRDANDEAARGSEQVARRTSLLIQGFKSSRVHAITQEMIVAIDRITGGGSASADLRLAEFLQRWSYDEVQLIGAKAALIAIL